MSSFTNSSSFRTLPLKHLKKNLAKSGGLQSFEEFVKERGTKLIKNLLIANNGIAAVKCMRSIRQWCYKNFGDESLIKFVAMTTPEDLKVGAEYIKLADAYEEVAGGRNNKNFANIDVILDVATRHQCDAVWAGWGHASENPQLPRALAKANIVFLGPGEVAMRDLGDKIGSSILAQSAGVNTIPWSGNFTGKLVTIDTEAYKKTQTIPSDAFEFCCVKTCEEAIAVAKKIGFPETQIMIKASEGGGGKGIRKVTELSGFPAAFRQVQNELPGSPIFVMKAGSNCRHLEVQIIADSYGDAIAVYGRDCSIQRRHQKVIEEGPIVATGKDMIREMEEAAIALTKLVGYQGAGTIEYLYTDDNYYFLELNPRLQVEHPVSEIISGVNLPATQLCIGMGIPLSKIPEIRTMYELDPSGLDPINFSKVEPRPPNGHVIACRITCEDAKAGFQPTSGKIEELTFRSIPNVWGYFSVGSGGAVHEYADSQIGHLFAWGINREVARNTIILGLKQLDIRGEIVTPVEFLIKLMETPKFASNNTSTDWLDRVIAGKDESMYGGKDDKFSVVICGAACQAIETFTGLKNEFIKEIKWGRIPTKRLLVTETRVSVIHEGIKYVFSVHLVGDDRISLTLISEDGENLQQISVEFRPFSDGGLLIIFNENSRHCHLMPSVGTGWKLIVDGGMHFLELEKDPTRVLAPSNLKIIQYLVKDKSSIKAGTPFVECEVMKMIFPLVCEVDGVITFPNPAGTILEAGELLASIILEDPSSVKKATPFSGEFPAMLDPRVPEDMPHLRLARLQGEVEYVLSGYYCPDVERLVHQYLKSLFDHNVPLSMLKQALSENSALLPVKLRETISELIDRYGWQVVERKNSSVQPLFPVDAVKEEVAKVTAQKRKISKESEEVWLTSISGFTQVLDDLNSDPYEHGLNAISEILTKFLAVEEIFQGRPQEDALLLLRDQNEDDMEAVYHSAMSYFSDASKVDVVYGILQRVQNWPRLERYRALLKRMYMNFQGRHLKLSLMAGKVLAKAEMIPIDVKWKVLVEKLTKISSLKPQERVSEISSFVQTVAYPLDALSVCINCDKVDDIVTCKVIESYIRVPHEKVIFEVLSEVSDKTLIGRWTGEDDDTEDLPETQRGHMRAMSDLGDQDEKKMRSGCVAVFESLDDMGENLDVLLDLVPETDADHQNILKIIVLDGFQESPAEDVGGNALFSPSIKSPISTPRKNVKAHYTGSETDEVIASQLQGDVNNKISMLQAKNINRLTIIVKTFGMQARLFTFRSRLGYKEDLLYRHIAPQLAYHLELARLKRYNLQSCRSNNSRVVVYHAIEKGKKSATADRRLFVRGYLPFGGMALNTAKIDWSASAFASFFENKQNYEDLAKMFGREQSQVFFRLLREIESILVDSLNELEFTLNNSLDYPVVNNSLFIKVNTTVTLSQELLQNGVSLFMQFFAERIYLLNISGMEFIVSHDKGDHIKHTRFSVTNFSGHLWRIDGEHEEREYVSTSGDRLDTLAAFIKLKRNKLYQPNKLVDRRRVVCRRLQTVYVYDYLDCIEQALKVAWRACKHTCPEDLIQVTELVIDENDKSKLVEVKGGRPRGSNTCGMVAWHLVLKTPEYPNGRPIIVIANDISIQGGSFGPKEDQVYKLASVLARENGWPRVYVSANAGARIGLAKEVMNIFQVKFKDDDRPERGIEYLYVTKKDLEKIPDSLIVSPIEGNPDRFRIDTIIGKDHGIGVENLKGSGLIAGETALSYNEVFTMTIVTGRSVGIGAYITRLGQRVIQNKGPILLTGYDALNRLLGKEVYVSHTQMGGSSIMYRNGVSHLDVNNDLEACHGLVRWLSFVPLKTGDPLPVLLTDDDVVDRDVEFVPEINTSYDPRALISGCEGADGKWKHGFFDHGSFFETMGGWAKTVVTGRARCGGIPVAVIAVETRTVEKIIPADPATDGSAEVVIQQAGQVWYPDSAYKTAQAIRDSNVGEELPLFIFANWRGFSGGVSDMFNEILKFGAMIVEALSDYMQPVYVYLPPHAELRGGAWAVIDPHISPLGMMEMYCSESSRGGILEPTGTVEIKFRQREKKAAMLRLDPEMIRLGKEKSVLEGKLRKARLGTRKGTDTVELTSLELTLGENEKQTRERQRKIEKVYHQIALTFAELHDTPQRMFKKETVSAIIEWKNSRRIFYNKLVRAVTENEIFKSMRKIAPKLTLDQCRKKILKGYQGKEDDVEILNYLKKNMMLLKKIWKCKC